MLPEPSQKNITLCWRQWILEHVKRALTNILVTACRSPALFRLVLFSPALQVHWHIVAA